MLNTPAAYRGAVSSPHHLASQAGLDILRRGGNAIEAAVATAATLAVVYPHMSGIGGDGFWLISEPDGQVRAIDACGRSAEKADLDLYAGQAAIPRRGALAANTVAGTVGGWRMALEFGQGRLTLASLLASAIHYARDGFPQTLSGATAFAHKGAECVAAPGAFREIFQPGGRGLCRGQRLRQLALAETFERLASEGLDAFYRGEVARDIAADLRALGSPLRATDFADCEATMRLPLAIKTAEATLFNVPPPTQGFASLLILALRDRCPAVEPESFGFIHDLVEATKLSFRLPDTYVGDPAWMRFDPQACLDSAAVIDRLAAQIDHRRAAPWPHPSAEGDTTWFACADGEGRVVSAIQSLFFEYGSGVVLPRTGILWQNRGSSFTLTENGPNALKPRRQPFHTLNPALARFPDGRVMAYGTMGGEGQPQTQAAIFTRYAVHGVPLQEAITRPRWLLGRTWGEDTTALRIEKRFPPTVYEALRQAGHPMQVVDEFSDLMGHAGAIVRHADGLLEAAADPRSDGAVGAW